MQFEVGDIVRMKGSSIDMCVSNITCEGRILVRWFDVENHLMHEFLPPECLMLVDDPSIGNIPDDFSVKDAVCVLDTEGPLAASHLNCAFTWGSDFRGSEYWAAVYEDLEVDKPLPDEVRKILTAWVRRAINEK